jgi:hypothetical protein
MTIVYWRGRKEKGEGKSLWSSEGLKYFNHAEKNGERCMQMIRRWE